MNNINKILMFILIGVVVAAVSLGSYYLYTYNAAKTGNINSAFVYTDSLPPATVGNPYKAVVQAGVFNLNIQIKGKTASGLPVGLKWTSCTTEYDSTKLPIKLAAKNSLAECIIEGTPELSGNFAVRVYFSTPGQSGNVYKDLPLVINP